MKSSPNNALQVELVDPPLHLRRQYICDKFLLRCFQYSKHPLRLKLAQLQHQIISAGYWAHKNPPTLIKSYQRFNSLEAPSYHSSSHSLFCAPFESLVMIPDICLNLGIIKYDALAPLSFKHSVNTYWKNWHYIFTDASKSPESSVFTGECFGLLKAVEYILLMKLQSAVVFSDAKSALQALECFPFSRRIISPVILQIISLLYTCTQKILMFLLFGFRAIPAFLVISGQTILQIML